jgi:hypothetical protein
MYKTIFAVFAFSCLDSTLGGNDSLQAAEQKLVRFDFEDGDPQGWEVVDGFIDPDAGMKGLVRKRQNRNDELGQFSLATDALQRSHGEWTKPWKRWAGVVESPVFVISGDAAEFWLGGDVGSPDDPAAWLALCSVDGKELRRAVPDASAPTAQRWELPDLSGRQVFLRLVDRPGGTNCIELDAFSVAGSVDLQATTLRRQRIRAQRAEVQQAAKQAFAEVGEIIFATRPRDVDAHYYTCVGRDCVTGKAMYPIGSQLCRLEPGSGELKILLDDPQGTIRDPRVSYDATHILFSYRPGETERFHLYEIQIDGTNLRQITSGPFDDIEPCYLPGGGIMFVSTRCKRYVPCWRVPVFVLHVCQRDGTNIRQISPNKEAENAPCVLPDGRIIYTRWEYVDRNHVAYHHLWTTNPDGSGQTVFFGNMLTDYADIGIPDLVMADARPIGGSRQVVAVFCEHMSPDRGGYVAIIDPARGPDRSDAVTRISVDDSTRDPVPLTAAKFLVAQDDRLAILTRSGKTSTVYRLPGELRARGLLVHEPQILKARPLEPVIAARTDLRETTGKLYLEDIYHGRNMAGVDRGEIKDLLVLEGLPKPVNFSGGMTPVSYYGTFSLARVLGTVPVAKDGSAYMELPAMRELFFVARDAEGRSVKRMQSFLCVQPGETTGCVGCHENRTESPPTVVALSQALTRPPERVTPIPGSPDVLDFPRDIQPILDKHCVECHDYDTTDRGGPRAGGVVLTGDRGPWFSHSYVTLFMHDLISHGDNRSQSNYAPRKIGSASSRLLELTNGSHFEVQLTDQETRLLALWIDVGANFAGTYAALGTGMLGFNTDTPDTDKLLRNTYWRRCRACHQGPSELPWNNFQKIDHAWHGKADEKGFVSRIPTEDPARRLSGHVAFNLSRPGKSTLLLAPLTKAAGGYGICEGHSGESVFQTAADPDYLKLLNCIKDYRAALEKATRFDMASFRPHPTYVSEMQRYGILPHSIDVMAKPINVYDADRAYWDSFHDLD